MESSIPLDGNMMMVLALRADFTPMLARLIVPRLSSLELPLRLFYRGDVLRYQEEHAGRQREFYQLGAEIVVLPGVFEPTEAEIRVLPYMEQERDLFAGSTVLEIGTGSGIIMGFMCEVI